MQTTSVSNLHYCMLLNGLQQQFHYRSESLPKATVKKVKYSVDPIQYFKGPSPYVKKNIEKQLMPSYNFNNI